MERTTLEDENLILKQMLIESIAKNSGYHVKLSYMESENVPHDSQCISTKEREDLVKQIAASEKIHEELWETIHWLQKRNKILEDSKTTKTMLDEVKKLFDEATDQANKNRSERDAWREVAKVLAHVCRRENCICWKYLQVQFEKKLKQQGA